MACVVTDKVCKYLCVAELKPRIAITLIPTLPAYVLFMCLRYTDHLNEDARCKTLLTNTINGIKKVSKVCELYHVMLCRNNSCVDGDI